MWVRPSGRPFLLDEVFSNFLVFGKAPRRQLRIDQGAVQADFKAAAVGGNPYQPLDPGLEFGDELVGQTDRPGFIVSSLTINEFYLHDLPLPVCVSLQNDSSIAAAFRSPGRDSHSPSPRRFQRTTRNCLNFVFGYVVTVDLWLSTSGVIVIAHWHLPILPWPQGKEHTARRRVRPSVQNGKSNCGFRMSID